MMQLKLSDLEIALLSKLVNGETVSISSQQRVRLELAGLIKEGANGIVVTLGGRSLVRERPPEVTPSEPAPGVKIARDRRGRRMPFQRKSIF